MTREEILQTIYDFSFWQGFYGRLYHSIMEDESILDELVAQNFGGVLDMIRYVEGG